MASTSIEATFARISLRIASTLEIHEVLAEITRGLVDELDAAMARIWLLRPGDRCARCQMAGECPERARCLHLVASAGLSDRIDGSYQRVPFGVRKVGEIVATNKPLVTNDLPGEPRVVNKSWVQQEELVSFAGYPLGFREEVFGVLAIFARRSLSVAELDRLGIFAAQASIAIENARLFEEVSHLSRRLAAENAYLKDELCADQPAGIVGDSLAIARVLREVDRVAPTMATVLINGETGTGKELVARAIHERSARRGQALITVNCAAMSPTLIESELFGHEKGAFTGALQRRAGRFELAQRGTLFLDEVGELPLDVQAKLLRVLQEHELERVGGAHPIHLDVRILCATNRDLVADVRAHRFRADLYYRLGVFPLAVPPLRDRREDIPLLIEAFFETLNRRLGRTIIRGIDDDALEILCDYDWPGNVRELHNVIERAAILARGELITVDDLPDLTARRDDDGTAADPALEHAADHGRVPSLRQRVGEYERSLIAEALRQAGGNQSEAARRLQMSRATLQHRLKVHRL